MAAVDWLPDIDDIGAIIPGATRDRNGKRQNTFTNLTEPQARPIYPLIETIVEEITGEVGPIPEQYFALARRTAALGAAALAELTFWQNEVNSGRSTYPQLQKMYQEKLQKLLGDVQFNNNQDTTGTGPVLPTFSFDDCELIGNRTDW